MVGIVCSTRYTGGFESEEWAAEAFDIAAIKYKVHPLRLFTRILYHTFHQLGSILLAWQHPSRLQHPDSLTSHPMNLGLEHAGSGSQGAQLPHLALRPDPVRVGGHVPRAGHPRRAGKSVATLIQSVSELVFAVRQRCVFHRHHELISVSVASTFACVNFTICIQFSFRRLP